MNNVIKQQYDAVTKLDNPPIVLRRKKKEESGEKWNPGFFFFLTKYHNATALECQTVSETRSIGIYSQNYPSTSNNSIFKRHGDRGEGPDDQTLPLKSLGQ